MGLTRARAPSPRVRAGNARDRNQSVEKTRRRPASHRAYIGSRLAGTRRCRAPSCLGRTPVIEEAGRGPAMPGCPPPEAGPEAWWSALPGARCAAHSQRNCNQPAQRRLRKQARRPPGQGASPPPREARTPASEGGSCGSAEWSAAPGSEGVVELSRSRSSHPVSLASSWISSFPSV